MSRRIRKPTTCIGKNKDEDQRLCFHYADSTIPPTNIQNFKLLACFRDCTVRLCQTWSETQIVGFLMRRILFYKKFRFLEIADPAKSFTDIKIGLSSARRDVRLKNQSCLFLLQCHAENSETVLHYYSVCTSISTAKYASFYYFFLFIYVNISLGILYYPIIGYDGLSSLH